MPKIGKLESVDVRELWQHEQYDFSAWLAKPENIEYLNDILGLTLVDVKKEMFVGSYRCDLVAKDETTGINVIIENQLEASNHDHLGKIITYASGLDAPVIVWIVKEAREEHRSAVEWLNNNTVEGIGFFLIELHAYKIDDSLPAPKFEIVEKPNDFIKANKKPTSKGDNATEANRLAFWTQFNSVIASKGKPFNTRKPTTDPWYDVAIGTSKAHITISLVNRENKVVVELYIVDSKALFDQLYLFKDKIEEELEMSFSWNRMDNNKTSRIRHDIPGLNFDHQENYPQLMKEIIEKVVQRLDIFKK